MQLQIIEQVIRVRGREKMRLKPITGIILTLLLTSILTVSSGVTLTAEKSPSSTTHDVAVVDVMPYITVVEQGHSMLINVTVENKGDFTETFNITAYYSKEFPTPEQWETFCSKGDVNRDGYIDDIDLGLIDDAWDSRPGDPNWNPDADLDNDGHVHFDDFVIFSGGYGLDIWTYFNILGGSIGRQTVNDLSPENSTTHVFTWNTKGVPEGNYTISAKATRALGETDITDNTYVDSWVTVIISGDIDGDGDIDFDDFIIFTAKYGSQEGEPTYDPRCDFNNDGYIDFDDFIIFSGHYGKSV